MPSRRSLPPPAHLRVTTNRHRVARRTNSLKSTGPRTPEGRQHAYASLKYYFGRRPAGPRQGHRLQQAIDRKVRFTPVLLRARWIANTCGPTLPMERPKYMK